MLEVINWKKPYHHNIEDPFCKVMIVIILTLASTTVISELLSLAMVATEVQGFLAIDSSLSFWLLRSYMFMLVITPLITIRLANTFGYKRTFFLGNLLLVLSSCLSLIAGTYWMMLLFRIIGGTGGGMILSTCLPILNQTFIDPEKRRPVVIWYSNIFFGIGISLGLIVGGYFGQTGHWGLVYPFHIALCMVSMLLALLFLEETEPIKSPSYDYLSLISLTIALFSMLFVITQVKEPWNTMGWHSQSIHAALAVAFVSFSYFVYHSLHTKFPLFDLRLFYYRPFTLGCIAMAAVSIMIFGVTMATLNLLETAYFYERWKIGLLMSSIGVVYTFIGIIPAVTSKYIDFRFFVLAGIAILAGSCFKAQSLTIQSDKYELGAVILMRAVGVALSLGPITALALIPFSRERYAKGSSLITLIRQLGGVFGSGWIIMIADTRKPFHLARFGEQVDIYSARFSNYMNEFSTFLSKTKGVPAAEAVTLSKQHVINNIETQAYLSSIIDAEYIIGWLLVVVFMILLVAMTLAHRKAILNSLR